MTRLARRYGQNGWIANSAEGVTIAIEGSPEDQTSFLYDLGNRLPPFAEIRSQFITEAPPAGYTSFTIQDSLIEGQGSVFLLPDLATCRDCLYDIFDNTCRFYRYPFTSCSYCGPRYSIQHSQPFDRIRTTMGAFRLCKECESDYRSVDSRRFHAQTLACPKCGPQLSFLDESGQVLFGRSDALAEAVRQLREGKIIALKGIGGYQLLADAGNDAAINRLRIRKHRPHKPFAVMVKDRSEVNALCVISEAESMALTSPAAPIVLLKRRGNVQFDKVGGRVAPDSNLLGVMLPYSPLHHLLLYDFGSPLVVTSGNLQDDPLCINERQALERLHCIADGYLTHNRSIVRPLDDSIVRLLNGKPTLLRRARGYCSLPIALPVSPSSDMMAVGGQLKSTVAVSKNGQAVLSQHLGDLDNDAARKLFRATLTDLQQIYGVNPERVLHDYHGGYASTCYTEELPGINMPVQHHYAHALSCMAEHELEPPIFAVVWDGSGLGDDGTLWGGEFLQIDSQGYRRFAHLRSFSLPGGSQAIREPRRAALGILYEILGDDAFDALKSSFSDDEFGMLKVALQKHINCPRSTSGGRLFDAVASLLDLCRINSYEGQAASLLENCAGDAVTDEYYDFLVVPGSPAIIDWRMVVVGLLKDLDCLPKALIAAKFHNTLAQMICAAAKSAGRRIVVLSGGCFQNAVLVGKSVTALTAEGFTVYCHERIPPNDGGLSLGQLAAAKYLKE